MKKMNNKGFAVSSLLYGLLLVAFLVVSIIMSIMSTNRKNTSTLIKKIEEELNRYSQTTTEITSTEGAHEFIVPYGKAGWYKIELWGAAAETLNPSIATYCGRGGYTTGIIYLEENTHLYFFVGAQGEIGGSTEVRLIGGAKNDYLGSKSRIMVAGGGGASETKEGEGAEEGYSNTCNGKSYISGYGYTPVINPNYSFIGTTLYHGVTSGAGKAKIELISTNSKDNPPSPKTDELNAVRYIRDCVKGGNQTVSGFERWTEIQAYDKNGVNVASGKKATINGNEELGITDKITDGKKDSISGYISTDGMATEHCVVVDLGEEMNLEEIVVFHYEPTPDRYISYNQESLSVASSAGTYKALKHWNSISYSPRETDHGLRFSSRDLEGIISNIPVGVYYIDDHYSLQGVITAQESGAVILDYNIGKKLQRWAIIPATTADAYYILEADSSKAILPKENIAGSFLQTSAMYGKHVWEEWHFRGLGNGYYQIHSNDDTNLCISGGSLEAQISLQTCEARDKTQWFKLVNADY